MIFGNRNLNTFGRCKVTKWSNSLYTDFERKSVTYRGRVLAQSEAPTVRSISTEVLVIASSAFDLRQKLDAIAKWLYESGESHLISTCDLNHYYNARCTSISVPSYEGPTATFTVKFTCSDDRLFTVQGDQPVRTATEAMNNFTFAGKHCLNDMHCVFVRDKIDAVPKSTLTKYSISGVSGTVVYDDGEEPVLSEKSLDGTLYFVKSKDDMSLMTDAEIAQRMHEISAWLINARRAKLILDSDTSRYYEAEVVDKMQLSMDNWHNGSIKLSLTLQPVSVSADESTWTESNVAITESGVTKAKESDESTTIGFKTPFVLVLDVTSSTIITSLSVQTKRLGGNAASFVLDSGRGFSLTNGSKLKIDSEECTVSTYDSATQEWVDHTGWIDSGQFPAFYPESAFAITLKGTAATVDMTVTCSRRWV